MVTRQRWIKEAVHCRAQVSVSRGPPLGLGCHPCPRRISRSPRRGCFIAPADRIRYETGRGTCAPGAPASPAGAVPPSACRSTSGCVQNPVWACPGRRFVPVPQGCRSSTIPSRACPDTSSMMSSMRCEQCVELVALSVLCVQRPGERRGSQTCLGIFVPPSLPGVRFVPRFGLGSYGASQNQKLQ